MLLHLSNEMIAMILDHVDDLVDAACFCLADGRLLAIGFPRLGELQRLTFAPWRGQRMICLGEYAGDDDYPASLQELVKDCIKDWPQDEIDQEPYKGLFVSFVRENFKYASEEACENLDGYYWDHSTKRRGMQNVLRMLLKREYDYPGPLFLCNLSKREYVRASFLACLNEEFRKKYKDVPLADFGHALLSRICWPSDSTIAMSYEGDLHRGPWAGDRFEVTTIDKIQGAEWKDVSLEVVEVLRGIWKSEEEGVMVYKYADSRQTQC